MQTVNYSNNKEIYFIYNKHKRNTSKLSYDAFLYERENIATPNFTHFLAKFNLDTETCLTSRNIHKICHGAYDRFWNENITTSSKAVSFNKYKFNIYLDPYLLNLNPRFRIALSRLRMSSHPLMIEKGRHFKPPLPRVNRLCPCCKDQTEDECHFLISCPLYNEERKDLFDSIRKTTLLFDEIPTPLQKFIFLLTNENDTIMSKLAAFTYNSFRKRADFI